MADITQIDQLKPELTPELVRQLSRSLDEPSTLAEERQAAQQLFSTTPVPDRVQHLWRYTSPQDLFPAKALDVTLPRATGATEVEHHDSAGLVLTPSAEAQLRLPQSFRDAGVEALPLSSERGAALAAERLGRAVPAGHGLFEALNRASWTTGVIIRVPRGAALAEPIIVDVEAEEGKTFIPRLLIVIESGAEATVVERHSGGGSEAFVIAVAELFVDAGAVARYVLDQDWDRRLRGHLTARAVIDRDASLTTVLTSFGGKQSKLDLGASLVGPGAQSELVGVALGEKRQHFDHHTVHVHEAPNTWSNIDLKVALSGRAHSAYTGLIRIEEEATETEAFQEERNLLLSPRARADAIPELEILNREVSCSHGATTSPVDPEQIFYLQTRGISAEEARRLVVRGFFEGVLERVPSQLRGDVERRVEERLARLGQQGGRS